MLTFLFLLPQNSRAVIRDGGVDPSNLGKGTWIYILSNAIDKLGVGNISSVSNNASLMIYMKNQGLQYVIIKAAQGDTFNSQFTTAVVDSAHAAGLKIFGYIYTTGANVPGEVAVVGTMFQRGADGVVFDGEGEWKVLANKQTMAMQLFSTVRANWPNKFLAHSPYAYLNFHTSFPFKEFGYYCDAVMPQDYFIEFGDTPTVAVSTMNTQYRNWQNSLIGSNSVVGGTNYFWTNSIKPLVTIGQGWTSTNGTITPALITEFFTALKTVSSPATTGGFKGANFWRAELHPANIWDAIRTNTIGNPFANAPVIQVAPVATASATTVSVSWPTDQTSDSVVEYGLSTVYGNATTNATSLWYHSVNVTGLTPNTTYHYRVKSKGTNNFTGSSADYVFTTATVAVPDIIIDQDPANNSGGDAVAFTGSWTATNVNGLAYLGTFRYASGTFILGSPTATAKFIPNIDTPGNYNVYASWASSTAGGNRATNAPFRISNNGVVTTVRVSEEANGNSFQLLAANKYFQAGTIDYIEAGNDVTASAGGDIVIADAVKLVYIPPPPSAPSISTQPLAQTVNRGNTATFFVAAGGTAPLAYQWKFNGTNILNATNSTYAKNNVQPSDAGNYSVGITNSVGGTNSSNAFLTVIDYPTIRSAPQDATRPTGSNVTFSVTATGTAPLSYQWKFNDTDIPGATGTNYTRSNLQTNDSGTYSVLVTNAAGNATASATLTVNLPLPLEIISVALSPDGQIHLIVSGEPGNYFIDGTAELGTWSPITNIVNTSGTFEFIDSTTNFPARFYRVRSSP